MRTRAVTVASDESRGSDHRSRGRARTDASVNRRLVVASIALALAAAAITVVLGMGPLDALLAGVFALVLIISMRRMAEVVVRSFAVFVPYMSLWLAFWQLRGLADETWLVEHTRDAVWHAERWLFGGELLNARVQGWLFDPDRISPLDIALTVVYASFFVVQLIIGVVIGFTSWDRIRQYLSTIALILGVGVALHFLLPMNPPWMPPGTAPAAEAAMPEHVYRVTVLHGDALRDYRIELDQNPLAAMPSIHMAMTIMTAFISRWYARFWRLASTVYVVVMAFCLVYLGEHFVIDEIAGAVLALVAWRSTAALRRRWEHQVLAWWNAQTQDWRAFGKRAAEPARLATGRPAPRGQTSES